MNLSGNRDPDYFILTRSFSLTPAPERTVAVALADAGAEVIHVVADVNGDEIGVGNPRFVKDMIRAIHKALRSSLI